MVLLYWLRVSRRSGVCPGGAGYIADGLPMPPGPVAVPPGPVGVPPGPVDVPPGPVGVPPGPVGVPPGPEFPPSMLPEQPRLHSARQLTAAEMLLTTDVTVGSSSSSKSTTEAREGDRVHHVTLVDAPRNSSPFFDTAARGQRPVETFPS